MTLVLSLLPLKHIQQTLLLTGLWELLTFPLSNMNQTLIICWDGSYKSHSKVNLVQFCYGYISCFYQFPFVKQFFFKDKYQTDGLDKIDEIFDPSQYKNGCLIHVRNWEG